MRRGDIYWARLHPRSGSEEKGERPVVVISHNAFNQVPEWRSVIIVPVSTSASQAKRGHTVVLLPKGTGGLKKDSIALTHQVTTLDRAKLVEYIGALPPDFLDQIEQALKATLDIL